MRLAPYPPYQSGRLQMKVLKYRQNRWEDSKRPRGRRPEKAAKRRKERYVRVRR